MTLFNCPDCGNEISDKAESCPKCGSPLNQEIIEKAKEEQKIEKAKEEEEIKNGKFIMMVIFHLGFWSLMYYLW